MSNPFESRAMSLNGPATDIAPVTPNDTTDMADVALALYVETGGVINFISVAGQSRSVTLADNSIMPVGVTRVLATGTTASGIHALLLV